MPKPHLLVALAAAACTDAYLLPPEQGSVDGRDTLFTTGSTDEQDLAEGIAYDWLDANADRVLAGIDTLRTRRVQIREGLAHVRIDQEFEGLPVFGAQAIVHIDEAGEVADLTDTWHHGVDVDPQVYVEDVDAVELAVERSGGWDAVSSFPDAELGVFAAEDGDHLTWRVRVPRLDGSDHPSIPVLFVDAHDGSIVNRYDDLQTATCTANTAYNGSISFPCDTTSSGGTRLVSASSGGGTYSIRNQTPWSITSSVLSDVTNGSTTWTSNATAVDAQYGILATLDYFRSVHGRNGIDGNGGPRVKDSVITAVVNYGNRYDNAYWDGTAMVFGDGDGSWTGPLVALDIAAHEMAHGVTQHSAGLVYQNQSGALNEAVSDIFGALVEHRKQGPGSMWKIGEDAWTPGQSGDALRYMNDPTADGQSADHWIRRYTGTDDNGGVHLNSGIPNLAFKLLVDGGTHPRVASVNAVPGIGVAKAERIWYAALTEYMTPSTDFLGARAATVNAAKALFGAGSPEVFAVEASWAEVGIGSPPAANPTPNPTPTPTPAPSGDGLDLTGQSAATGQALAYPLQVPQGATNLVISIGGGTGDADLYVKQGSSPTDTAYDCRPYRSGNQESCTFAAPAAGTWYVVVKAYSGFTGLAVSATWTAPAAPPPTAGPLLDRANLAGGAGSETRYSFDVPAGKSRLSVVVAGGTGDLDLYVRRGAAPTQQVFDCRPYESGNDEVCTFEAPASGTWHVLLHGYAQYAGARLTASAQ
jgi:Zn-dependent metalloprotease